MRDMGEWRQGVTHDKTMHGQAVPISLYLGKRMRACIPLPYKYATTLASSSGEWERYQRGIKPRDPGPACPLVFISISSFIQVIPPNSYLSCPFSSCTYPDRGGRKHFFCNFSDLNSTGNNRALLTSGRGFGLFPRVFCEFLVPLAELCGKTVMDLNEEARWCNIASFRYCSHANRQNETGCSGQMRFPPKFVITLTVTWCYVSMSPFFCEMAPSSNMVLIVPHTRW